MKRTAREKGETLARRAYREIRQGIINGNYQPGQRMSLRPMARTLGTSLAPVLEAFRELNRDGLIELEPGWGARVRRVDRETLRNQHILRTALECETIRQCTQRATPPRMEELRTLAKDLDKLVDGGAEPQKVQELDSKFHLRIAQFCGVSILVEALKANQLVRLLARGSLIAHDLPRPKRQHLTIVEAIETGDPDNAARAMREHCVASMNLQLEYVDLAEV